MNSENAENGSDSSNGRALKIRAVAATVLEELGQLRSAGSVGHEALDVAQRAGPRKFLQDPLVGDLGQAGTPPDRSHRR